MLYKAFYNSNLGQITMLSDGQYITDLRFEQDRFYDNYKVEQAMEADLSIFELTRKWLDTYFAEKEPTFTVPIKLEGTEFQMQVWQLLQKIPYGITITYKELADKVALIRGQQHMSAQAVGNAVGRNPISIIVPCHRVIGAKKKLVGYASGVDIKAALLASEGVLDVEY